MARMIHCKKLNKEAEGLDFPPYPGDIGKQLYESVSKEAWQLWLRHQTMLINEYRLSLADPKSQAFLKKEMENYFFGEGSELPADYVPEQQN